MRAMAAVYVLDENEDPVELLIVGKEQRMAELEAVECAEKAERQVQREQQDQRYLERITEERSRTITINYDLPIPGLKLSECRMEEQAVREAVRRATGGERGVESVRLVQCRDNKGKALAKIAVYVLLEPGVEKERQHWEHAKLVSWSTDPSNIRMEGRIVHV